MNEVPRSSDEVNNVAQAKQYILVTITNKQQFLENAARYMFEYGFERGVNAAGYDAPYFVSQSQMFKDVDDEVHTHGFNSCVPSILSALFRRGYVLGYESVSIKRCPTCGQEAK